MGYCYCHESVRNCEILPLLPIWWGDLIGDVPIGWMLRQAAHSPVEEGCGPWYNPRCEGVGWRWSALCPSSLTHFLRLLYEASEKGVTVLRKISLLCLALLASIALLSTPVAAAATPFPQTGYSITNDKILDYFNHRGGVRVFGYPISRDFDFMGTRVQFFQRAVLQIQPDGGVGLLNLLSNDLLPYTRINGSTFPAADPQLLAAAPFPSDPDYTSKAIDFVKANAPDNWQGMNTNFFSTFMNTVTAQDAFPNGGNTALLPLINLEIWGLPTSSPAYDPNNSNFVYLRFQRGIMHFDKTTGLTQGILLGDYLKSIITGQNLPADLAQEAQGSKLYQQYNNSVPNGVSRPADLPGTNLFAAFEKDGVVVPTPAPATPTPVATPTPAVTPTPQPPANIDIEGSPQFINVISDALNLLANKSPYNYSIVKQYVYKIQLIDSSTAYNDYPNHALDFNEAAAYVQSWYGYQDQQTEWVAGVIVHNAVLMSLYYQGQPTNTIAAETQALTRQQDVIAAVDTTSNPEGQFRDYMQKALNNVTGWFGDYQTPPGPQNP